MYSLALSYTWTVHYLEHVCYACASNMYKQNTQPTYPTQKIQSETQHTSEMLPDGEETIIHQRLQKQTSPNTSSRMSCDGSQYKLLVTVECSKLEVNHNYTCFVTSRKAGDRKLGTSKWNFPCIAVLSCCLKKMEDRMIMEWIASCNDCKPTLTEQRMPCVQAEPGKSQMTKMTPKQKQLQNRTASNESHFEL